MRKIIYIATALTMLSCSPQKRLNHLIRNHPELVGSLTTTVHDTFTLHDTTIIKEQSKDTTFADTTKHVVLDSGNVRIEYRNINHRIYLQGKCKGDTIYKDKFIDRVVKVDGKVVKVTESKIPFWIWIIIGVLGLLLTIQTIKK